MPRKEIHDQYLKDNNITKQAHGHPTADQEDQRFQEEKAAMKKRNLAKRKKEHAESSARGGSAKKLKTVKLRSDKLNITLSQMLDRLIDETKSGNITTVDWFDKESITRRRAQFGNVKELLAIIKMLREAIEQVIEDELNLGNKEKVSKANVSLIADAKKAMANIGIKNDL